MMMPNHFTELFEGGTKPVEWKKETLPTIHELIQLLQNQVNRIGEH